MSLYGIAGTSSPTYLLADPAGADVISIPCEPSNGTVHRGTIMYRKESGLWAPAASDNVVATNQLAVLDEEVDTAADTSVAEDAKAFRAARLIAGKVTLASDGKVTEAHKVILRAQGLVFDQMQGTATFDNTVTT